MATVSEFFHTEAGECLRRLDEVVGGPSEAGVDATELLRLARLLRGSAQMAREDRVEAVSRALEAVARALVAEIVLWDAETQARVLATLDDLRALIKAGEGDGARDARAEQALARLRPEPGAAPVPAAAGSDRPAPADEFLAFAAREVSGIVDELDRGLSALERDARSRDPLKAILRRQRALLGSARLEQLPAVAAALRAIDEICRLIARQDAPVEGEWLRLFRTARSVLGEAADGLVRGGPSTAAASLPTLELVRAGLLERYGMGHEAPAPRVAPGVRPPRNVVEFFRHEAGILLGRIERMAGDLARASADRQTVLRRELQGALTALRDTALGLGFGRSARMAETALSRVAGSTAAEVLDLLPNLRETVAADRPASAAAVAEETAAPTARESSAPEGGAVAAAGAADGAVPVETLVYRGDALASRASELRPVIEGALAGDAAAREALDELFDLIRLGLS